MAEKGTPIEDGASGDVVATRDAFELDSVGGASRVIQRVDFASGRGPSPLGTAKRGSAGILNSIDTLNLTALPTDLTSNLIDVGDKSTLILQVEFTTSTAQDIVITPLMYDNAGTPGIMGVMQAHPFSLDYAFYKGGANYITPAFSWDTLGAHKIGIHITQWPDNGGSIYVKVYGWVI